MEEEHRGVALVILGIIAVIAVIGLVLMFSGAKKSAGAIFTSATNGEYVCPISTKIGEPQWFPVLAGPYENDRFLQRWIAAGYECHPATGATQFDEYSYGTWCCRNPVVGQAGINPQVLDRGDVSLDTRRGFGVPVGSNEYGGAYPRDYPYGAGQTNPPRIGP
jgi:hypothetical protein